MPLAIIAAALDVLGILGVVGQYCGATARARHAAYVGTMTCFAGALAIWLVVLVMAIAAR